MTHHDLLQIKHHAKMILAHRDEPSTFCRLDGCAGAMIHDADDILKIVDRLLDPYGSHLRKATKGQSR